jgi:hypothetical protein
VRGPSNVHRGDDPRREPINCEAVARAEGRGAW